MPNLIATIVHPFRSRRAVSSHPQPPRPRAAAEPLESRLHLTASGSLVGDQHALNAASPAAAWGTTRGSAAVVVANVDSGVDYTHEDLYANIWINPAEIPPSVRPTLADTDADGRISFYDLNHPANRPSLTDANGNGSIDAGDLLRPLAAGGWADGVNGRGNPNDRYVDDIVGWDFADGDNDPFDGGTRPGHGTHTAGVTGAMADNTVGISGVAPKVSTMIVRIFGDAGTAAAPSRIAEAVRYAADGGARVATASWQGGGSRRGDALHRAIAYAGRKGQLFVTAAGNDGRDLDSRFFNVYPAEYALPNIVTVAATAADGRLAGFSNYGAAAVDVAAPGSAVLSTLPGNRYGTLSGTSMAAPFVAGAAALMLSANPSLTPAQLKQRLITGSDASPAFAGRTVSRGQLNISNAVLARPGVPPPRAPSAPAAATASIAERVGLSLGRAQLFSSRQIRAAFGFA